LFKGKCVALRVRVTLLHAVSLRDEECPLLEGICLLMDSADDVGHDYVDTGCRAKAPNVLDGEWQAMQLRRGSADWYGRREACDFRYQCGRVAWRECLDRIEWHRNEARPNQPDGPRGRCPRRTDDTEHRPTDAFLILTRCRSVAE
jgi:hypothetical protein